MKHYTRTAAALVALVSLAGCAALNDPNNPNRQTQQGAIAGATVGALIGIASGDTAAERRQGAIKGAILGGAAGAVGGSILDKQEAQLRDQMGSNARIVNTGDELIVTLPQDILFGFDSTELTGTLRGDLAALAKSMNDFPGTNIAVIGHTDNVGDAAYNLDLSRRRAQAVAAELVSGGVSPSRLRTLGYGENEPIATNLTPEGRQQNRRVEIIITPN